MSDTLEREIREFLSPRGPLAKFLPRYEKRPEQGELAAAALRAIQSGTMLVAEAGTGTGKTLAYLTPAIYSNTRVVISTGTKALQEQLIHKDLPILEKAFKVKAALMKGRSNYLCLHRYHEFEREPIFNFRNEIPLYAKVGEWILGTKTGDRAEIRGLPDNFSLWRELSATGEQCLGQKCQHARECYITKMRAAAQEADIIVVNHHLFFADLSLRNGAPVSVIPEYHAVIFDEAHALPEVATEYFGAQASTWRLADLGQDIRRIQRASKIKVDDLRTALKLLDVAELAAAAVFKTVGDAGRGLGEGGRFSLRMLKNNQTLVEEGERAGSALKALAKSLKDIAKQEESSTGLAERASSLGGDLGFILAQSDPDHVYWAEVRGRGVILRASPAELGPILQEKLYGEERPIIFTSATLAVRDAGKWSFSHFRRELGLDDGMAVDESWLASSYDWRRNAILYVPEHLPDPADHRFIIEAAAEMEKLVEISRGRCFLLFTSYRNLEAAYSYLEDRLPYPLLKQGDAPRTEILEEFRASEDAVLFGTQSFWEGVDVAGQTLSCVVVDKLPFGSPGDPLLSARLDRIRRKGGNPFRDYQLPSAVISLKQGLGRLIRSRGDYGILAVLDKRLKTKSYGKTFLESLPPAPRTANLKEVREFFSRAEALRREPRPDED